MKRGPKLSSMGLPLIWTMPESKHSFLWEMVPNTNIVCAILAGQCALCRLDLPMGPFFYMQNFAILAFFDIFCNFGRSVSRAASPYSSSCVSPRSPRSPMVILFPFPFAKLKTKFGTKVVEMWVGSGVLKCQLISDNIVLVHLLEIPSFINFWLKLFTTKSLLVFELTFD